VAAHSSVDTVVPGPDSLACAPALFACVEGQTVGRFGDSGTRSGPRDGVVSDFDDFGAACKGAESVLGFPTAREREPEKPLILLAVKQIKPIEADVGVRHTDPALR
jgi:hypothetical protein